MRIDRSFVGLGGVASVTLLLLVAQLWVDSQTIAAAISPT